MCKYNLQIFIPTQLNSGAPAPAAPLEDALATLCELGGGATLTDALGVWTDPRTARVYRERVQIAETDAEGEPAALALELDALAQRIGAALGQIAVYVRIRETDARAITITQKESK